MADHIETQFHPLLDEEPDEPGFQPSKLASPHRRRPGGWVVVLAIVLVIVLVSGGFFYWRFNSKPPVTYTQQAVTSGNISVKIAATGPITPNAQYNMNFSVSGQVSEIDVQVGQHVKQGQKLAKVNVDKVAMQDAINQDQLGVTSAQDAVNAAYTAYSNAQTNAANTKSQNTTALQVAYDQEQADINTCQTSKSPPPNCVQTAQDKYTQTQAQLNSSTTTAQNQVTTAQGQITTAQDNLDKANAQLQAAKNSLTDADNNSVMTAPADATVAAISGLTGQNVGSGSGSSSTSSSSSAFITLIDTSKLSILAQVNEADIGNVQTGQTAQFTVAAYPSKTFRATVSAIDTIGQTTSNVVNYTVHLAVDQNSVSDVHLYPGMTATANITTAQRIGTLLIPSSALSFTSTALRAGEIDRSTLSSLLGSGQNGSGNSAATQGSDSRIVLVLRNGKLTPVRITVGLSSGQYTEVLSGLNEGDQVVVGQTGGNISTTTSGTGTGAGGRSGGFGGGGTGGGGTGGTRTGSGG